MRGILKILVILFIVSSCISSTNEAQEEPIATINGNNLYPKELKKLFRKNVSEQDSIDKVKNYIDNWIKEQVMLARAEAHLSEEDKDVEEKLNSYRNSLLIYKYQEQYIKQNLDTVISNDEIQKYYQENVQNFRLDNNLVKALYIKISNTIPRSDINQMVRWMKSNKEEDAQKLYDFCIQYAENFDNFNSRWIAFNMIQMQFPYKVYSPETTLKWRKFFDTRDDDYLYYLRIDEFVAKSQPAPIEYINAKIRGIILNKRKITLIKHLENEVYNDALNNNLIKTTY